jgi:hypothetical protein
VDIVRLLNGTGGTLTLAGGLGTIIAILFRMLVLERRAHTATADRLNAELKAKSETWSADRKELLDQWRTEIARINADHDQEIAEMRAKISRLETSAVEQTTRFTTEVSRLNVRLDAEMELRRAAQDRRP